MLPQNLSGLLSYFNNTSHESLNSESEQSGTDDKVKTVDSQNYRAVRCNPVDDSAIRGRKVQLLPDVNKSLDEYLSPIEGLLSKNRENISESLSQRILNRQSREQAKEVAQNPSIDEPAQKYLNTSSGSIIINVDQPVAEIGLQLLKKGFSVSTHHIQCMRHKVNMSDARPLVDQCNQNNAPPMQATHLLLLTRQRSHDPLTDFLATKMPEELNSTEKIEAVLLNHLDEAKTSEEQQQIEAAVLKLIDLAKTPEEQQRRERLEGRFELLYLRSLITQAREHIQVGSLTSASVQEQGKACEDIIEYLDFVDSCLNLYRLASVKGQNPQVLTLINKALLELRTVQTAIKETQPSGVNRSVLFKLNPSEQFELKIDEALLKARCSYASVFIEFTENSSEKNPVEFTIETKPSVVDVLLNYLITGESGRESDLTEEETVLLLEIANKYMITELEKKCLIRILLGISTHLFSKNEMKLILTQVPLPEIQQAVQSVMESAPPAKWSCSIM